jgi:hypothetical protein
MNQPSPAFPAPLATDTAAPAIHLLSLELAFNLGVCWASMPGQVTSQLMDHVGGSEGLMRALDQWAHEFYAHWTALPAAEHNEQDYSVELGLFLSACLEELMTAALQSVCPA